ncbi:MAG TPA: SDR family oxidoreductase [Ilumatobacteraceae bacterium]|nr:SDR family oxidoreductase [Ilumatobacteraceae bacterium]
MNDQLATISFGFTPGDVVLVTGAASGIGKAAAIRAAQMGLDVAAWDLNLEGLHDTIDAVHAAGRRCLAARADVADDDQVRGAFVAVSELGPIRYLVNNAGPSSAVEIDFDEAIRICIGSVRRVTDHWLDRGVPPGASLVNLASVAGNKVATASDWYTAVKAGIAGYTRHLAAYRADQVRSNAVAPGMIDTPRLQGFAASDMGQQVLKRVPMGRIGQPDDIAFAILFLLSPLATYINGSLLVVDGGWTITQ